MTYSDSIDRHTSGMPPGKAEIVPLKCTLVALHPLITAPYAAGSFDFRHSSSPETSINAPWVTALTADFVGLPSGRGVGYPSPRPLSVKDMSGFRCRSQCSM